jgi:hypothetical protein
MEPEKITREEIEQAQAACLACIESREAMADCLVKLKDKLLVSPLDASLLSDWMRFVLAGQFMAERERILEARLEEVKESMQVLVKSGAVPVLALVESGGAPFLSLQ